MRRSFKSMVTRYTEERGAFQEEAAFWENIYVDRDFYVQALTDKDNTVLAFGVTTRKKWFRPKLLSPGGYWREPGLIRRVLRLGGRISPIFNVKLGKTRFSELEQPVAVAGFLGAHNFGYWEAHWLGHPGNYQHYVFGVNDARPRAFDSTSVLFPTGASWELSWPDAAQTHFEKVSHLGTFRSAAAPNTYAVLGQTMSPDEYPLTYGPQSYHVRTIP